MNILNYQVIQFVVMFLIGIFLNPMNVLAYKFNHLYLSTTLIYSGLLMASNMIWAHELIHYFTMNHINLYIFFIGIILSLCVSLLLRNQVFVNDNEWLKRMIPHHSTAITTSSNILKNTNNSNIKYLAEEIIKTQENEIIVMKSLL